MLEADLSAAVDLRQRHEHQVEHTVEDILSEHLLEVLYLNADSTA